MSNELAVLESQLTPLQPRFAQVLGRVMPVERLMRTIIVSAERNPDLLRCERQSLLNAAMTFAVLGLEVDGVTGQGFLVPFKDSARGVQVVQPIIGYLGYNTLGARAGLTITGRVVREGDGFEFDESAGWVHHSRKLGGEVGSDARRITAAWAKAEAKDRPPVVRVLSIDELLAVKAKSPRGNKPPWADPAIGYPAMCEKTAKRRLRRDMPLTLNYSAAATMEESFEERGLHTWIHPEKGVLADDGMIPIANETPTAQSLISPPSKEEEARMTADRGRDAFSAFCKRLTKSEYARMKPQLESLAAEIRKRENEQ